MGDSNLKEYSEMDVKVIGDMDTLHQIVKLLAYIRHSLRNNQNDKITLDIGSQKVSDFFAFQVNNEEIQDYITQNYIQIN